MHCQRLSVKTVVPCKIKHICSANKQWTLNVRKTKWKLFTYLDGVNVLDFTDKLALFIISCTLTDKPLVKAKHVFGHNSPHIITIYTKRTCLWVKAIVATNMNKLQFGSASWLDREQESWPKNYTMTNKHTVIFVYMCALACRK